MKKEMNMKRTTIKERLRKLEKKIEELKDDIELWEVSYPNEVEIRKVNWLELGVYAVLIGTSLLVSVVSFLGGLLFSAGFFACFSFVSFICMLANISHLTRRYKIPARRENDDC